jgi:hypothetical protein
VVEAGVEASDEAPDASEAEATEGTVVVDALVHGSEEVVVLDEGPVVEVEVEVEAGSVELVALVA